jgi:hypothetical protein
MSPKTPKIGKSKNHQELNRKLAADVLRIKFHCELVEDKLQGIGLAPDDFWLPHGPIEDLIFDHAWSGGPREVTDEFMSAWHDFASGFESTADFDPAKFVEWVAKGMPSPNPFEQRPAGPADSAVAAPKPAPARRAGKAEKPRRRD